MKKLIVLILIIISAKVTFSQQICNAAFQYWVDYQNGVVNCVDSSFLLPGYSITSNEWTIRGGGMAYTYSDTTFCSFNYSPAGTYDICYTIITENLQTGDTCGSTNCITITVNNNCNIMISPAVTLESAQGAQDGAIDLTVTGGYPPYSFLWSNGAITEDISNLASGSYGVYIRSVNDTSWCNHFSIFVGIDSNYIPCNLTVSAVVSHVSVIGGHDGSIDLIVTGGITPYNYVWSTGAFTEDINNLAAGRYIVSVGTADSACSATLETWILEPYSGIIVDTLLTSVVDSCLGFQVDSFYISSIIVSGSIVTVNWVFIGGGMVVYLPVDYIFSRFGGQMVILNVFCPFKKGLSTYSTYINIREDMGIDGNKTLSTIYPYPNPSNNIITIDLPSCFSDISSLVLYNSVGEKVMSVSYTKNGKLNIESLSPGFYYLSITDNQAKTQAVGRFIKQ